MLSKRHLALGLAMLTAAHIAAAAEPPARGILVQYTVSENSPDRVQDLLTSPLEQTLRSLPRIVTMRSVTGHGATGVTVDIELQFAGGATAQDMKAVLGQLAQQDSETVAPVSVSVHLQAPRAGQDADPMLR